MGQCESLETIVAANEQLNFVVESTIMCTTTHVLAVLALFSSQSFAQVGIGTTSPHGSAALEISSTDKGLLIPRMTTAERNAILNPVPGMILYNSTVFKFQGFIGLPYPWIVTDPNNTSSSSASIAAGQTVAQTFLAPTTEDISSISAIFRANSNSSAPIIAEVYGGVYNPSNPGNPLATSNTVTVSNYQTYFFSFTPTFQPISGHTYTVVFTNTASATQAHVESSAANPYALGYLFFPIVTPHTQTNSDLNLVFYDASNGSWIDL